MIIKKIRRIKMYCTKCGKQISDDSQFCCYCGARQTPIVNNNTPINTANKNKNQDTSQEQKDNHWNYSCGVSLYDHCTNC
ncbi:MAG: zinc-ribbon domain-containing protein [Anaerostipes hadrus]